MNPQDFFFTLPRNESPSNIKLPEVWYPNVKEYWERSTTKRIYNPIFGIEAIVIHATAGYSSEGAMSVMKAGRGSWHWLVPDENEPEHEEIIWACAPETLAAWHVRNSVSHPDVNQGKNKTNHWSLGVEIVNRQVNDPFSDWQVQITADIVKYCWAKYPNLKYIVSHAKLDPTRRTDPGADFPWNTFKELVLASNYNGMLIHRDLIANRLNHMDHMTMEAVHFGDICC